MLTADLLWRLLISFDIPVSSYGKGKAKRLEDLFNEVNDGDCELIISKSGIHRRTSVIRVKVTYNDLVLREEKQVYSDDREDRKRGFLWVSEKTSSLEDKEIALKRTITEELGIKDDVISVYKGEEKEIKDSPSYPGLPTEYIFINFEGSLKAHQFNEDGYIEKEGNTGLTTYFKWVKDKEWKQTL